MPQSKLTIEEKKTELVKYRLLILTTIDYTIESGMFPTKSRDFDFVKHFEGLKKQTEEHYQKGRLTRLKQWFRDLTEMYIEIRDLKINKYLQDKTKLDIDIFKSFYDRIKKVVNKGKITTDNQFYDIKIMVEQLYQTEPNDIEKIEELNILLVKYEQGKSIKK